MTPERAVIEALFRIPDKEQQDVDFSLNAAQRQIDDNLCGRDVVPKARREGVTSYFLARSTVKCLTQQNTVAVVISHETEATQRMLARVQYYLDNIRGPKAVLKTKSKNELSFPKTNSVFYIGTAGSRAFGRGDGITDLHCSEVAYWPDPKTLTVGLFQAVARSGRISVESTGNGAGDWYHNLCLRAAKGQSRFRLHFLPWHTFPEYTLPGELEMPVLNEDLEEDKIVTQYGLTPGQVLWRREKLEELDWDIFKFKAEYPMTLDDCFQSTGRGIFVNVNYQEVDGWKRESQFLWKLEGHPHGDLHYVIGADVAAGVGQDSSVAEVFCLETMEQVGEWISNRTAPDIFAVHLSQLGLLFNNAYIGVEANNHGILTLGDLRKIYPIFLIHRTPVGKKGSDEVKRLVDYGIRTSVRNKPFILGTFRKNVIKDALIHSPILKGEMNTFVEDENGKLGAIEGHHDDCVMAAAIAHYIQPRAAMTIPEMPKARVASGSKAPNPFTLESIIKEMRGRGNVLPFRSQLALGEKG